ncbi:HlyD family efflux transporter periplasmic adaptor subunit [Thiotrichales bacterium 19S3-7]|nr:HlyD family efflux transporter periplasmic adaptor subunit [Thiotrichales bacterium 19S3-7]MCF6800859.1 HlyD family efflux transporter periplasmic adaptor subunit [Thiotrichales bacterium 19S3-11]
MKIKTSYLLTLFIAIIVICLVIFFYVTFFGNFTRDAYLYSRFSRVNSLQSNQVIKTYIHNGTMVNKGDTLFTLDDSSLKLQKSILQAQKSQLEIQQQDIKKQLKLAENQMTVSKNLLNIQKRKTNRFAILSKSNEISKNAYDKSLEALELERSKYITTQTQIANITSNLNNTTSQIKILTAKINQIQYDINQCIVKAKLSGIVSNFRLEPGDYIMKGIPLFSIVNTNEWVVIANVKESDLKNIKKGQQVSIMTSVTGYHLLKGTVMSIGIGIDRPDYSEYQALPNINRLIDWIRLDYRFPVMIQIEPTPYAKDFKLGSDANVWF